MFNKVFRKLVLIVSLFFSVGGYSSADFFKGDGKDWLRLVLSSVNKSSIEYEHAKEENAKDSQIFSRHVFFHPMTGLPQIEADGTFVVITYFDESEDSVKRANKQSRPKTYMALVRDVDFTEETLVVDLVTDNVVIEGRFLNIKNTQGKATFNEKFLKQTLFRKTLKMSSILQLAPSIPNHDNGTSIVGINKEGKLLDIKPRTRIHYEKINVSRSSPVEPPQNPAIRADGRPNRSDIYGNHIIEVVSTTPIFAIVSPLLFANGAAMVFSQGNRLPGIPGLIMDTKNPEFVRVQIIGSKDLFLQDLIQAHNLARLSVLTETPMSSFDKVNLGQLAKNLFPEQNPEQNQETSISIEKKRSGSLLIYAYLFYILEKAKSNRLEESQFNRFRAELIRSSGNLLELEAFKSYFDSLYEAKFGDAQRPFGTESYRPTESAKDNGKNKLSQSTGIKDSPNSNFTPKICRGIF